MKISPERKMQTHSNIYARIGLVLIGAYAFFVALFQKQFAQLNITLSGLNFPIFIGEILIAVCIVLLLLHWRVNKPVWNAWYGVVGVYFVWMLIKALKGYVESGPLAFRNAALMYYPILAVFTYEFYQKEFFSRWMITFLLVLLIVPKYVLGINIYCILPVILMGSVLLLRLPAGKKWFYWVVFVFLLYTPPNLYLSKNITSLDFFFYSSRNRVIGHIVSITFLCSVLLFLFFAARKRLKVLFFASVIFVLFFGFLKFADPNAVQSLTNFSRIKSDFHTYTEYIDAHRPYHKRADLKPRLYSPEQIKLSGELSKQLRKYNLLSISTAQDEEKFLREKYIQILQDQNDKAQKDRDALLEETLAQLSALVSKHVSNRKAQPTREELLSLLTQERGEFVVDQEKLAAFIKEEAQNDLNYQISILAKDYQEKLNNIDRNKHVRVEVGVKEVIKELGREKEITFDEVAGGYKDFMKLPRDINTAFNNIYFRLFIWRDMLKEMVREKAWLGVSFGKPQRSESIEILGWATMEWRADGWITPHNSFLHILYRGGLVGGALIVGLFGLIFYLIRGFIQIKCLPGILLMTVFVYWVTISNFLVFLEFPYNAVHFWGLLGMTLAFYRDQRKASEARS